MTIIRTILCNMPNCGAAYTERQPNAGFPGWGHVAGLMNSETGEEIAHICPGCKSKIIDMLRGEKDDGVDGS